MLAAGIILYWIGTGFCEAYKWVKGLPIAITMFKWYHLMRIISQLGILTALFTFDGQVLLLLTSWIFGWALYEITINLCVNQKPFVSKVFTLPVLNISIPFPRYIVPVILAIDLMVVIYASIF